MCARRFLKTLAVAVIALCSPAPLLAADVLTHVPQDALGFVVIKNLDDTDTKVAHVLTTLRSPYPSPLVFLKAVTAIDEGLNPQGSLLIVALPDSDDDDRAPQFAVWLPVADYNRVLLTFDAKPNNGISAIRVADEDLLIAQQDDWAVVMDPDDRERMKKLLSDKPAQPELIAAWKTWIDANDVAAVLLPDGVGTALAWSGSNEPPVVKDEADDEIFGDGDNSDQPPPTFFNELHAAIRKQIGDVPEVLEWLEQSKAIGCAARFDDHGNALSSLRLKSSPDHPFASAVPGEVVVPYSLHDDSDYRIEAAGRVPPSLMKLAATTYSHTILDELRQAQKKVNGKQAAKFTDAFVIAVSDVESWQSTSFVGNETDGVYTNNFLVVRTKSSNQFVDHGRDVLDRWNEMNSDVKQGMSLKFEAEELKFGDRPATQYSIDMTTLEGMPAIPEIRQLMEKFFGPGARLRTWVVAIDDHNVLLAAATKEQVEKAVQLLDRKQPIDWNGPAFAATNKLLPEKSDLKFFFNPSGYSVWKRRRLEAEGGAGIGGRQPKEFPKSPPIALAGEIQGDELQIHAVVPAETIQAAGATIPQKKNR